jgi:hypothetical protein
MSGARRAAHRRRAILALGWLSLMGPASLHAQRAGQPAAPGGALVVEPGRSDSRRTGASSEADSIGVIVRLRAPSVASQAGSSPRRNGISRRRFDRTAPEARRRREQIATEQRTFEQRLRRLSPRARVSRRMQIALNAVSAIVPRDQVRAIAALPDVEGVYPDRQRQLQTTRSPGFIGAPSMWNGQSGPAVKGDGIVIALVDSGIWPEHPSFADPAPSGAYQAPAGWSGGPCEFGSQAPGDPPFTCTNKILTARRMMSTYDQMHAPDGDEFLSARDEAGHGTLVASIAAGNASVDASILGNGLGAMSGVAPRAQLAVYKVCGRQGCYDSDILAAVEQAIDDGVDIIHLPIDGGSDPFADPLSLALLDAHDAGIFVVTAAGNGGIGDVSGRHEPWAMTVGATTIDRTFVSALTLRSGSKSSTVYGVTVTPGITVATPVLSAASLGDATCATSTPDGALAGRIVVCARGGNSRVEKSFNVQQRGGVGMILVNPVEASSDPDNHFLPTVHLNKAAGDVLSAFLAANPSTTATFTRGTAVTTPGDTMAAFTSRGSAGQALGISKPDIVAPGVQILGAQTPDPWAASSGAPGQNFQVVEGTSIASAHVAGAAALLAELHPDWSPDHIKSALMLTATQAVRNESGATGNLFDFGSGRIRLDGAGQPGIAITPRAGEFLAKKATLWDVNYPALFVPRMSGVVTTERTIENLETTGATWYVYAVSSDGFKITVPATITLPPGGTASMSIVLDATGVPIDSLGMGAIYFIDSAVTHALYMPVALLRKPNAVPISTTCSSATIRVGGAVDCAVDVANIDDTPAAMTIFDSLPAALRIVPGSVTGAMQSGNAVVVQSTLAPALPEGMYLSAFPPYDGYLPLSTYYPAITCSGSCDDRVFSAPVPAGILFNGTVYQSINISTNGFVQLGGSTLAAPVNQQMPDAAAPNSVLAPFWTDLHPAGTDGQGGGQMYAGYLTYPSGRTWLVIEWRDVRAKGLSARHTFQVWLQTGGQVEDVTFSYMALESLGANGALTVGAEDGGGLHGTSFYYNGAGTAPAQYSNVTVASTQPGPGGTARITFRATGQSTGTFTHCGAAIRDGSGEIAVSCLPVTVTR